jgi:molybdate transport system substrate-binding protein
MRSHAWMLALLFMSSTSTFGEEPPLRLRAAGSLRAVMTEISQGFTASGGVRVESTFGASGLLREGIEKGDPTDVFASADVRNVQLLSDAGRAAAPVVFTRNQLCALLAPGIDAKPENLLERMLDPAVKLGTSTPKADPSGDYAWQLFEKAEKLRAGAYAALDKKALKLTGGADSPQAPAGRSIYGMLLEERKADIFLTYCTNALAVTREVSGAQVLAIPDALAVGASYALTVMNNAPPAAQRFALYVMSISGQAIVARHGFTPVALP